MKCVMLIASALLAAAVAQQMAASPPRVDLGDAPEDDGSVAPSGTRARRVVGLDNTDKDAVLALFNDEYLGSSNDKYTWTGDIGDCDSGSNSAAHKKQVLKRVNYFRTMVGLPAVVLDDTKSDKCREAALIFSASGTLTHYPNNNLECYNEDGDEAAGKSNIAWGTRGVDSVDAYIDDNGDNNKAVGHRRWFFLQTLGEIGVGDVGTSWGDVVPANAIWVVGDPVQRADVDQITWPSEGYVPFDVLPSSKRWSLTLAGADFGDASVSMSGPDGDIDVDIVYSGGGVGDPIIVFEPDHDFERPGNQDQTFSVTVSGIGGGQSSVSYTVTVFDTNPPTGPMCKKINVSGRSGLNSIINGNYNHEGDYLGVPYFEKSNLIFYYNPGSQGWLFVTTLGSGASYANLLDTTTQPESSDEPVRVYGGSGVGMVVDNNVELTCAEYYEEETPSSSVSSSTTEEPSSSSSASVSSTEAPSSSSSSSSASSTESTASSSSSSSSSVASSSSSSSSEESTSSAEPTPPTDPSSSADPCAGYVIVSKKKQCKKYCAADGLDFDYSKNGKGDCTKKVCECECPKKRSKKKCKKRCKKKDQDFVWFKNYEALGISCEKFCAC